MIDIKLSYPQLRFCRELINSLADVIDIKLHGFTVTCEGLSDAEHFLRKLYGIRTKTTRDYVTLTAIERKVLAGIKKMQGKLIAGGVK